MPSLDDYQAGRPLNEAMEALMRELRGDPEPTQPGRAKPRAVELGRELTNDQREDLRRLTMEPGWGIYMALRANSLREKERSATLLSQTDPLANRDRIAEAWAYIAIWKQVVLDLDVLVNFEIAQLDLATTTDEAL